MPCGSSEHCPTSGGFPCDTHITCHWITFETTGPGSDPDPRVPNSGMLALIGSGGVGVIDSVFTVDNGAVIYTLQGNGFDVDTGGGGLSWDTGGGGWSLDTNGGGITWQTGGGGFDIDTQGGTWSMAGDGTVDGSLEVDLPAAGLLQVRDSGGNPIFEVRNDGTVHILTGTAIIADL